MAPQILIVDDHPSFRTSARILLEADGYEVIGEAADGASALEATRRLHPDVILLDVQLPDMDGFEVAARIAAEANGHRPAVVLTSSRDWADYGRVFPADAARGFVPKGELSGAGLAAVLA